MDRQVFATILPILLLMADAATAQTSSVRTTVEAYGARLNNPGQPATPPNARRYNNRIDSRIDNRISLRIERFRVGAAMDPLNGIRNTTQKSTTDSYRDVDGVSRRATMSSERFVPRSSDPQMADIKGFPQDQDDRSNMPAPR